MFIVFDHIAVNTNSCLLIVEYGELCDKRSIVFSDPLSNSNMFKLNPMLLV